MSRRLRHPVLLGFGIVLAPAVWILFVGSGAPHELLVGAVASIATVLFLVFVCRTGGDEVVLRPRDLVQLWRVPWYVVSDVVAITMVALKDFLHLERAESLYRVCGFDSSKHDAVRKARTVLAIAYTTATPNSIVIGIDPSESRMLFHQLASSPVSRMTRALGAKS